MAGAGEGKGGVSLCTFTCYLTLGLIQRRFHYNRRSAIPLKVQQDLLKRQTRGTREPAKNCETSILVPKAERYAEIDAAVIGGYSSCPANVNLRRVNSIGAPNNYRRLFPISPPSRNPPA
jgi:hypothetical protein